MTKLIHREGDIFQTHARAIGHGVNTQGMMGAGIAVQFRNRFPEMHLEYRDLCKSGKFSGGDVMPWSIKTSFGPDLMVFNIASQEKPGANASYEFLINGVRLATDICELVGHPVLALPRIGSGIGGLDGLVVEGILHSLSARTKVDIELWMFTG